MYISTASLNALTNRQMGQRVMLTLWHANWLVRDHVCYVLRKVVNMVGFWFSRNLSWSSWSSVQDTRSTSKAMDRTNTDCTPNIFTVRWQPLILSHFLSCGRICRIQHTANVYYKIHSVELFIKNICFCPERIYNGYYVSVLFECYIQILVNISAQLDI